MSSAASSLGSSTSTANYFSGMSNYAQDLNNAISREVQIASLPIQLLQNNVTTMTGQANELNTVASDVSAVQTAVSGLSSAAGSMLAATVSDGSAAATVGSGATAGTYSLQVTNLGSIADALSMDPSSSNTLTTVADPTAQNISTSKSYTLTVGTATTTISYSGGNLNGLAQAINNAGAGVQATVVDVGTSTADYRLSLQSDQLGPMAIQLNDGSQDLLAASGSAGTLAQYTINGKQVSSNSDTVTLAPGLTAQLTSTNSKPATVTVAASPSGVLSAMQSFVSAYNAAITELGKNRGQSGGALSGDSIVYQTTDSLQNLANYTNGDGAINSLATLGLAFNDTTGQLTFNQSTFASATSGQTDALAQFLGSATDGGFLETATNAMTGLMDPSTGVLSTDYNTMTASIASTNAQITTKQNQVTQLQANLTQQMAAADAMIYDLQQQATQIQNMFTAMQDAQIGSANGA